MKYLSSLFFFLFCYLAQGQAQPFMVRGSVTDTMNATPLSLASVVLIRTSDSVIAARARTRPDGRFETKVNTQGKYFLRVTFPGFADYIDVVNVKKANTDLGDLPMISKSHLLQEFVLTQQISAIKIKGDTTEYMADSFKVKEGATVEDLLKKLPGIQVDKNGQIVAQGESVQKVLVDGEEFFSDDPKVVTRGLQADAVKKVQVYDKKSDQADFTGIDDGQKTKTINLELKEEKKKGYFGKVDAGGGSDGYFQNQGMINAFKAKRQLSAFGIMSNTDKAGLGWQDNDRFGSGNGTTEISDDGSFVSTISRSEEDFAGWNGKYNGEGLPTTWTGGAHYADKWNETKQHISANYRFARQNVDMEGNTMNQFSLPGNVIRVNDTRKDQFSTGDRHGFDIMYDWKIDSNTSVKITANAGAKETATESEYNTDNYFITNNVSSDTINNRRNITSFGNAQFVNTDLLFRHKFAKKGRTLSIDAKENYKDSKNTGNFNSTIYYDTIAAVTRQEKVNNSTTLAFSGKATYTEPLSKVAYAEISYGLTVNNSTAENKSFDTIPNTTDVVYSDDPNKIFSSDYRFNILSNSGGLNFKFVFKDFNFNFGGDVSNTDFLQTDLLNGGDTRYNFVNLFPKAAFTYRIGKQTSFNVNYQGSTRQPTINQLQPFTQNTDPLNVMEGNPNLKQEFINKVALRFNDYKILQSRFLWATASFSTISDAISTSQRTDSGVNKTSYINVNGNYNGFGYLGYGFKINKTDFMVGAQINGSVYHINNQINLQQNSSDNTSLSFGPYVNYDKENKFELRWNPQITYNNNVSTNNPATISYYIFNNDLSGSVQLPAKIELGSSVDMMFRQTTEIFTTNNNVIRWNAYVEKKFLKMGELALRISVYDILNQNLGFSRTAQGSIVTQNSYNTIRRYGMLNLIWNFSHTPAGAPPPSGGGMMMMR
jgi:hypothetical protein